MRVAAYVYPGWHPIPERDLAFHPGFTEWELVEGCRPRFDGHVQPRRPALGPYDDRDPAAVATRLRLARDHGIDAFVHGFFWCRGKRVFQDALDRGYLGSDLGRETPYAVFWANRMPRRVLPVRRADVPVIDPERQVPTDVDDFVKLIGTVARGHFARPNYLTVEGRCWFAIYDVTFFIRELGPRWTREAILRARRWLSAHGYPDLHLAAIDPAREIDGSLEDLGFDSVTHYVFLPRWRGPTLQDYATCAEERAGEWSDFAKRSGLPYMPSVATGWDASPRGADFGDRRPDRYPWSPVVVGEHPDRFREALVRALRFRSNPESSDPLVFVASLNEWSEGHYLEPDDRFGEGWLRAVREARRIAGLTPPR